MKSYAVKIAVGAITLSVDVGADDEKDARDLAQERLVTGKLFAGGGVYLNKASLAKAVADKRSWVVVDETPQIFIGAQYVNKSTGELYVMDNIERGGYYQLEDEFSLASANSSDIVYVGIEELEEDYAFRKKPTPQQTITDGDNDNQNMGMGA